MTLFNKVIVIAIFGILANIGLFMNPGYFSHDEIGWGLKALSYQNLSDIKYYNIFNYNEFHYRPLNFNLWLISSYYFFDTPQLFHLVLLSCGVVNSVLFYFIVKSLTDEKIAFIAALISSAMPSIVFVNGWIGTIADIFWFMSCCLSFLLFLKSANVNNKNKKYYLFLAIVFFVISLMFKETAVVYPAVIFLYIVYDFSFNKKSFPVNCKTNLLFFIICTFVVITYLALRFEFLFPKHGGYGTSLGNVPIRMLEYFIFPFLLDNTEIHGLFEQYTETQLILAIVSHVFFIIVICRKSLLCYSFYFLLYYVGSIPILILDMSLPHYIYASGFTLAACISILINRGGASRILGLVFFTALSYHSFILQKNYFITGVYQNNFLSTFYSVLSSNNNDDCQILVEPVPGSISWVAVRSISFRHQIDDLVLPKDIVFDRSLIASDRYNKVCRLSLDINGRVKLTGIDDINAK